MRFPKLANKREICLNFCLNFYKVSSNLVTIWKVCVQVYVYMHATITVHNYTPQNIVPLH